MSKKRILITILVCTTAVMLQACSENSKSTSTLETPKQTEVATQVNEKDESTDSIENNEAISEETAVEPGESNDLKNEGHSDDTQIDTSVFVYAEKVDVTDSRDITDHLDLVVHMKKEVKPGLATQHVFTQAYDFLQQKDIEGAKSVTIGVMSGEIRVSQITVDVGKFNPKEHLIQSVLKASEIDKMDDDVKDYGKVMELW